MITFDDLVNSVEHNVGTEFCRRVIERHNTEIAAALNEGGCGGYRLDDLPYDTYREVIDRYRDKFAADASIEDREEIWYLNAGEIVDMIVNYEGITRWELSGLPYHV